VIICGLLELYDIFDSKLPDLSVVAFFLVIYVELCQKIGVKNDITAVTVIVNLTKQNSVNREAHLTIFLSLLVKF